MKSRQSCIHLNMCAEPTQKLGSGLVRVQALDLLHVLRHHSNPLLGRLLFKQRSRNVL